jgi:hypothetical protein
VARRLGFGMSAGLNGNRRGNKQGGSGGGKSGAGNSIFGTHRFISTK